MTYHEPRVCTDSRLEKEKGDGSIEDDVDPPRLDLYSLLFDHRRREKDTISEINDVEWTEVFETLMTQLSSRDFFRT